MITSKSVITVPGVLTDVVYDVTNATSVDVSWAPSRPKQYQFILCHSKSNFDYNIRRM